MQKIDRWFRPFNDGRRVTSINAKQHPVISYEMCQALVGFMEQNVVNDIALEHIVISSTGFLAIIDTITRRNTVEKMALHNCIAMDDNDDDTPLVYFHHESIGQYVGQLLAKAACIVELDVSMIDRWEHLSNAIRETTTLRRLTVRGNQGPMEELCLLGCAIAKNTSIIELTMKNVTDRGSCVFAGIAMNKTIVHLVLETCTSNPPLIDFFDHMLARNTTLRSLTCIDTHIEFDDPVAACVAMARNSTLRKLSLVPLLNLGPAQGSVCVQAMGKSIGKNHGLETLTCAFSNPHLYSLFVDECMSNQTIVCMRGLDRITRANPHGIMENEKANVFMQRNKDLRNLLTNKCDILQTTNVYDGARFRISGSVVRMVIAYVFMKDTP